MPLRLILAFALSLALHGGLLVPDVRERPVAARSAPPLLATLRRPPQPVVPPDEPLLKNTLDRDEALTPVVEPPPMVEKPRAAPSPRKTVPKSTPKRDIQAAQRKLSETQFYPPAAIEQGLEGEVRLIVKLHADGTVSDVSLAASSGHALLDNAAIRAAYAMGQLTGASARELILPVIFRLQ
ncbi:MAG: energy transducer TonB [Propionivibrio sp.]